MQPSDLNFNSNLIIKYKPIKVITKSVYELATFGVAKYNKKTEYTASQISSSTCTA